MHNEQHLYDLLKDFDTAMMITEAAHPQTHARPMAIAELQPDADAYFVTSIDSPKIKEIQATTHVTLTFQSGRQFAALYGTINLVRDRSQIDRLWKEAWKVWFPKGKDDLSITLLQFTPSHGEYWDNAGIQGIKYALKAASAYLSGTTPETDTSQYAKVDL
jgi:general stress protein 26